MHTSRLAGSILAIVLGVGLAVAGGLPAQAQNFGGNVAFTWQFSDAPRSGLTDITFHQTLNAPTAHVDGTYVAQQFGFTNQQEVGYMGLQPRADSDGRERLRGVFSSFIDGTVSSGANCVNGADGGPGVSCGVEFDGSYGDPYELTVSSRGNDTWAGTAKNSATGVTTEIGTFSLPAGSGNLGARNGGFVENYDTVSCSTVSRIDVSIGLPTTTSGAIGSLFDTHEYGNCLGEANYAASSLAGGGEQISRGWSSPSTGSAEASAATLANPPVNPRANLPAGVAHPADTKPRTITGIYGLCLDVRASDTTNGTPVILWGCTGNPNQQWTLTETNQIQSLGKCLTVAGDGLRALSAIVLSECTGASTQAWVGQNDGSLLNPQSGKYLDSDSSGGAGTQMILFTGTGNPNQKWSLYN